MVNSTVTRYYWWFRNPAITSWGWYFFPFFITAFIPPNGGWPWDFWTINSTENISGLFNNSQRKICGDLENNPAVEARPFSGPALFCLIRLVLIPGDHYRNPQYHRVWPYIAGWNIPMFNRKYIFKKLTNQTPSSSDQLGTQLLFAVCFVGDWFTSQSYISGLFHKPRNKDTRTSTHPYVIVT